MPEKWCVPLDEAGYRFEYWCITFVKAGHRPEKWCVPLDEAGYRFEY